MGPAGLLQRDGTFALRDHWRLLRGVPHQLAPSPLELLSPQSSASLGVRPVARGRVSQLLSQTHHSSFMTQISEFNFISLLCPP